MPSGLGSGMGVYARESVAVRRLVRDVNLGAFWLVDGSQQIVEPWGVNIERLAAFDPMEFASPQFVVFVFVLTDDAADTEKGTFNSFVCAFDNQRFISFV